MSIHLPFRSSTLYQSSGQTSEYWYACFSLLHLTHAPFKDLQRKTQSFDIALKHADTHAQKKIHTLNVPPRRDIILSHNLCLSLDCRCTLLYLTLLYIKLFIFAFKEIFSLKKALLCHVSVMKEFSLFFYT